DLAANGDRVVVQRGVAGVHVAQAVDATAEEQDPLGEGGLARIDVGHDSKVAESPNAECACHVSIQWDGWAHASRLRGRVRGWSRAKTENEREAAGGASSGESARNEHGPAPRAGSARRETSRGPG